MMFIIVFVTLLNPFAYSFNVGRNFRTCTSRIFTSTTSTERDEAVQDLLWKCKQVGQIGVLATQEERDEVEQLAKALEPFSDPKPARQQLSGTHRLVYSAATSPASGRLVGPLYGKVTQTFLDDETYTNQVEFGPLLASVKASKTVLDDYSIQVEFQEQTIKLFGQILVQKEFSNTGVWTYLFYGRITDADGAEKLVRVMETPNLFVIEQQL